MSSFTRHIERQLNPSQAVHAVFDMDDKFVRNDAAPARKKFYGGRGSRLGVHNPKDKASIARRAREAKRVGRA